MVFVRFQFYVGIVAVGVATVANTVSISGFDLSTLLPYPAAYWETTDPEVPFFLIAIGISVWLVLPLFLGGRLVPSWQPSGRLGIVFILLLSYFLVTFAYLGIRFHGGGPAVHHGQLTMQHGSDFQPLAPAEYHRDVAVVMTMLTAGSLFVFYWLTLHYRDWLRDLRFLRALS